MSNRTVNVGVLSALCALAVSLGVLSGCSEPAKGKLLIAQVDLLPSSAAMQAFVVCLPAGSQLPVSGATVTVNGESVPEFFGNFSLSLPAVSSGQNVTLHFAYEDIDILSTLVMPAKPSITTGSGTYAATDPITIGWALISPAPDNIVVSVPYYYTNSTNGYTAVISGALTSHTIPGSTFISGQGSIPVVVEAMSKTTDLGSSMIVGSYYMVGNQSSVPITTSP